MPKGKVSDIRDASYKERLAVFKKLLYGVFCTLNVLLAAGTTFCVIYGMVIKEPLFLLALISALVAFFLVYFSYVGILTRIDHIEATELILEELRQRKNDKNNTTADTTTSENAKR